MSSLWGWLSLDVRVGKRPAVVRGVGGVLERVTCLRSHAQDPWRTRMRATLPSSLLVEGDSSSPSSQEPLTSSTWSFITGDADSPSHRKVYL